jgi:hypothetical protein
VVSLEGYNLEKVVENRRTLASAGTNVFLVGNKKSIGNKDRKSCQDYKWKVIVPYHTHSRSPRSSWTWT